MRVVFLGTPAAAVPALEALLTAGHDLTLVMTQPDRPAGRSLAPRASPVKARALELDLAVTQPRRVRDAAFLASIVAATPDVLVVVAYGRILPGAVLAAAPHGAVNVHFSLLPAYRGAAPVQWALACGESTTGVTTMSLNERLDEGDVYLRRSVAIEADEHAPALTARLAAIGADLLVETLRAIEFGTAALEPQDPDRASYAPPLTREHGELDPGWRAADVAGRVRGFDPWPGVWAACRGRRVRLVAGREIARSTDAVPGTIVGIEGDALIVACGAGTVLELSRLQPEGSRVMTGRDAVNGRRLATGDRLERPSPQA